MATNRGVDFSSDCLLLFQRCKNITGQNITNSICGRSLFQQCFITKPTRPRASPDHGFPVAFVVILTLIAIFSFLSNVFVCLVFILCKEVRKSKHYLIVNLAVADILIAALAIPFFLTKYINQSPKTVCQIGSIFDVLCCTSSIIGFAVISLERFVAVRYPLRYTTIVSRRRCLWVIALVWLYSIAFSLSSYIPVGDFHLKDCVFFTDPYIVTVTFTSFVLPLLAMLVTYGWIFKVAKAQVQRMNNNTLHGVNRNTKNEFKAAKTLTLIIGVYVVCWFPFFAYISMPVLLDFHFSSLALFCAVQLVRYLNSLANPFIYVGINREFRLRAFKMLKDWTSRNNSDAEISCRSQSASTVLQRTSEGSLSCENVQNK